MAAPLNRPDLTFADAEVGDFYVDLRQRVDWGAFEVTAKVDSNERERNYIEGKSIVTGSVVRVPEIDWWAKEVKAS